MQVIALLKEAFQKAGLGLYVAPYGVLPTAYECGIVEVVPNTQSRSALGETSGTPPLFAFVLTTPGACKPTPCESLQLFEYSPQCL